MMTNETSRKKREGRNEEADSEVMGEEGKKNRGQPEEVKNSSFCG